MSVPLARTQLIQQLLACSTTAAQMACKMSSDEPKYEDYSEACSMFKGVYEFTLSRFGTAIRAVRDVGEDGGLPEFSKAKRGDKDNGQKDNGVQPDKATDELGLLIDSLVQHLAGSVERRIQVEVVPTIRYDSVTYLEEVLPDVEDRILRRLEDRLGMYKATHPIYTTLCTVLARRLADTITHDVQERVYWKVKGHLLNDLEESVYWRVKERMSVDAAQEAPSDAVHSGVEPEAEDHQLGFENQARKRSRSPSLEHDEVKHERL